MNENLKKIIISLLDAIDAANAAIKVANEEEKQNAKELYDRLLVIFNLTFERYSELKK